MSSQIFLASGISQISSECDASLRSADGRQCAHAPMLQPPVPCIGQFLFNPTPYNLLCTQSQFSSEQHQSPTMAEDTYQLISQLQEAQTSDGRDDLWDFGSYPERKGDCLLFEKEVLAIQVGKYQKCEKE